MDVSNSQSHISTEGCENKNRTLEMSAGEREPLVHHNDIMPQKYRDGKAKACPLLSILMFWCSSCMLRHGKQFVFNCTVIYKNFKNEEIINKI